MKVGLYLRYRLQIPFDNSIPNIFNSTWHSLHLPHQNFPVDIHLLPHGFKKNLLDLCCSTDTAIRLFTTFSH
jgi:hypothetical protein